MYNHNVFISIVLTYFLNFVLNDNISNFSKSRKRIRFHEIFTQYFHPPKPVNFRLKIPVTTPLECLPNSDPKGKLYFGTQNVADSGDLCQRWDVRNTKMADQGNYCRNRDNSRGPWCYTVNPKKPWGYCHIPKCWLWATNRFKWSNS